MSVTALLQAAFRYTPEGETQGGLAKALTIPVSKLEDAIESNVWFDGSSIEGFARISESDMYLKLDLNTFTVIPWSKSSRAPIPTSSAAC